MQANRLTADFSVRAIPEKLESRGLKKKHMKLKFVLISIVTLIAFTSCKKMKGPRLTINGSNDTIVTLYSTYLDPGALATNQDGTSLDVTVDNPVNTSEVGYYYISYIATNDFSSVELKRKVTVLANIGQTYKGGMFFSYLQPGDIGYVDGEIHGLLCSTSDQSTGVPWGCQSGNVETSDLMGSGANNTLLIENSCGEASIAAKICSDLTLNGYSDWHLPSKNELQFIYQNLHLNGLGNFSVTPGDNFYWSSSQFNNMSAWHRYFAVDYETTGSKTGSLRVRAIRKF